MYKLRLLHRGYSLAPLIGRESAICFFKYHLRPKYLIFMPVTVVYINPVCKWQWVVSHAQLQLEKKINTLIEIRKHIHGKCVSGVFSFFFHDTEKECLLHTNKNGFFREQNKYSNNTMN